VKGLLAALGFLTSIPLPRSCRGDLAAAPPHFPLAGALLGMVLAAVYGLGGALVGRGFAAAAAVCALAALTGGIHLDGLADTFDALGSGRDREGMLQVMRDPHVGTFGVVAVGCVLILKFSLLLKLPQGGWRALVLFPALGRMGLLVPLCSLPYLRGEGKVSPFLPPRRGTFLRGLLFTAVLGALFYGLRGLLALSLVLGFCYLLSSLFRRRLGGMTGDVLGATVEMAEVVALVGLNLGP